MEKNAGRYVEAPGTDKSVARVERRNLNRIPFPFPGLRKLLLSATNLVRLELYRVPHSGYISPEVMFT